MSEYGPAELLHEATARLIVLTAGDQAEAVAIRALLLEAVSQPGLAPLTAIST